MNVKLPAAALATQADPAMSERYVQVDTRAVVSLMIKQGWEVASARAAQPRKRDPLYARHVIDFRRPGAEPVLGAVPRVLFTNSHNGTSSARALAGFFRFVCSNGLVVGHKAGEFTARHAGRDAMEFVHEMQTLAAKADQQRETIYRWNEKQLTLQQREEYARLVGQLRWNDAWAYDMPAILAPRRAEDDTGTLWSCFNRAQENTVRGGLIGLSRSGRRATSQPLTDIGRDLAYNAALWRLTDELSGIW